MSDMTPPSRKTVALVLGSGSSRGWAHIGAIEALVEEGIPIDFISGCSVGSYVGAIFASGSLDSLKHFVLSMDGRKVFSYFDVVFPRSGLLDGTKKVAELFSMHTAVERFSELNIPVMMVATDLQRGEKIVLKSGPLLPALRATMSVPGLFAPARVKGRWLVDGGVVDPVPVGVARATEADVVIAVDLNSGIASRRMRIPPVEEEVTPLQDGPKFKSELLVKLTDYYETAESNFKHKINELLGRDSGMPDIIDTVMSSINIMQERITRINLAVEPPDVLIQPRLGALKMMDFDQVELAIEEGYIGVREKMEDIKALLETPSTSSLLPQPGRP
ncbi:phosphoesterase [Desulfosarcina alkanivorans]|uniref:Phosphoesterase n=1 Tax=Desulfosarcina alkanivorans TaxID=571177 RepID=A0A5K7YM84_9BACT|nr:patatin-like phospholipase family protein [Desulfosarcina alkanivorans]BBO69495.1 phosphoesterase [Desulfosarcina alkanivorans]